jgi:hypothetical protein
MRSSLGLARHQAVFVRSYLSQLGPFRGGGNSRGVQGSLPGKDSRSRKKAAEAAFFVS